MASENEGNGDRLYEEAQLYRDELAQRGIIYMGRIPPFMKPNKAKALLEKYGEVTRIYLAEEETQVRQRRKENGGNGSRQFREGWIEFADKKVAKQVADTLNNTIMGGKKSDYYHDDIWNLKYLKGFRWEHLTEKLTYERRIRETKMRAALLQVISIAEGTRKMNKELNELVEQTEIEEQIADRKRKRDKFMSVVADGDKPTTAEVNEDRKKMKRKFKQNHVIGELYDDNDNKPDSRVLNNIFSPSTTRR